ncbi:PIG-L family deacetylase [Hymenobacter perfusus]|uniref:LmbE family protein n=1 Tax=Hymenobacter perfusus TaxID=1236770 RepID=A0A3R9NA03_9BACT|nr:PIG-L family deacetylase [Hymenobacter perfusus]RSK42426.1 LmbE family protein [Hymenobacter perfusus]
MRFRYFRTALAAFLITNYSLLIGTTHAQAPKTWSSSEILLGLKKLNVLGSALYVAAHPDDENTRLIAYLANGRLVETGYLSCTRGDGGQNLIGPELREGLGVIRTQELLAARRIDGGRQFFTRANDFGFSKTPEETFTIWDKEQVLADMVWVIRQRRPDVMITRFPPDGRAGHGHHTASAMLAIEAFSAAADPKRFPEQLQYVQPWQAKRLLWNTGSFFVKAGEDMSQYLKLDAGGYNPLLGQSYGEIAARSRSQHRSQGFGSSAQRGEALEYFQPLKGDKATTDLFDGVDMTWNRVPGGAAVGKLVDEVIRKYDPANPSASVAGLLKVREAINSLFQRAADFHQSKEISSEAIRIRSENELAEAHFWVQNKIQQNEELIRACLGIHLEATAEAPTVPLMNKNIVGGIDNTIKVDVEIINRSSIDVKIISVAVEPNDYEGQFDNNKDIAHQAPSLRKEPTTLMRNEKAKIRSSQVGYWNELKSQPYWLQKTGTTGMYVVVEPRQRGNAEGYPAATAIVRIQVLGQALTFDVPVQYKSTDPVEGEKYRLLTVVPPVAVNIGGHAFVFADNQPKIIPVTLRAGKAGVKGTLALNLPKGWTAEPASIPFELGAKDAEQTVQFRVQPGAGAAEGKSELRAVATVDGQAYSRGYQTIEYTHIPTQTLFPEAVAPLVKLDLRRKGQEIGYLMGAGDEVPDALRQIGYTVTLLKPEDLTEPNLRRFDAVVLGVRAYNTLDRLKTLQPTLLKYVEQGGNLVVQYTVSRGTVLPQIGPYPLTLSTDRVTVENAPVTFLNPSQPLLNTPNKITSKDFEGWVQEQGLYYPSQWDPKYKTVLSSADPGEKAKESAILVADYGKGHYIYTGLSLFRELPAGVPGAYRLLTNMVSLGK